MDPKTKMQNVKDVALYLRKSRGEEEDLEKHRGELIELCIKNEWRYVIFSEIGMSISIEQRPELKNMIAEIEQGLFDAVLVMDKDRLSREGEDQAKLNKLFAYHNVLIITPDRVYDLNSDSDILMSEVEDLMARFEYRMIKKRFTRGKKRGAKMGNWTNGTPPFPYEYSPEQKGLIVNQEKLVIYRYMLEKFLEGNPFYEIAWQLNKMRLKSPRGSVWQENTIRRILLDETHLGRIISNKSEGGRHRNKPQEKPLKVKPRTEWIVVENCHEAVKTVEEHEKIKMVLAQRKKIPGAALAGKYPLSGLIRCGLCGKTMQFVKKESGGKPFVKKCQHADPFGNRCPNRGGDPQAIISKIHELIDQFEKEISQELEKVEGNKIHYVNQQIQLKHKEIQQKEKAIDRIDEAYEAGIYNLTKYTERISKVKQDLQELYEELDLLHSKLKMTESITNEEKLISIREFRKEISEENLSDNDKNRIYKMIIDSIFWTRQKDDISIDINFL